MDEVEKSEKEKVELVCGVYSEGTVFSVEIERTARVEALQKAIADILSTKQHTVPPRLVTLYLARKDGAWLEGDTNVKPFLKKGRQPGDQYVVDLFPIWRLDREDYLGAKFMPGGEEIHILVEYPEADADVRKATTHGYTSSLYKRKRWELINAVVQSRKRPKAKKEEASTPYSDADWSDLESLYSPLKQFTIEPTPIAQAEVDALYSCLVRFTKVFGGIFTGKESKRLFFIAPILAYVSHLLDDVQLLVGENVNGRQVQTNGHFEFVIRRGQKCVGVVEAKKDDIEQGMAQILLGCEALSDVEQLPVVFGIVTNYTQWIFFRSETDVVYEHDATIDLGERGVPTMASLAKIAGMIYSLLV
ncbi:hypothetical protein PINS_up001513 [Pythium insidiosum]|nr:hypothetical protein PINS_up001513 [Pythium insidiosum]